MNTEFASFGAGCFWCVEAVFSSLKGVLSVLPGYAGGHAAHPSYEEVCTGETGHAEICHIEFDPNQINFGQLLEVFFKTHDPTTLNRQGGDLGTQYRSVIFYHSEQQKLLSEKSIAELNKEGIWENPIVTVVEPFDVYYPAENYHRDYYKNNPNQQYCSLVIHPKIEKFKKVFGALLK